MKKIIPILMALAACQAPMPDNQALIEEVYAVEKAFNDEAAASSVKEAFIKFAADDAVLNRNNRIIRGKEDISAYFDASLLVDVSLQWEPDFVDVSDAGDLAYTYGGYTFSAKDTTGQEINATGIFHTVWKRQADGSWKYVYD